MIKKRIRLTEKELKRLLINEVKKQLIKPNTIRLNEMDELQEYMWLKPSITNLSVDMFVDDGGAYLRHNHELLLFARNGYGREIEVFIPFSISRKPKVLDDEMDFNISYEEIFAIQDFIQENFQLLKLLANQKISQELFVCNIKKVKNILHYVNDNKSPILEMATLRSVDSKLPVDIWLDEGGTCQKHAPRIKFRASNDQRTTREFSSMLITSSPTIENMPTNSPLRKKDIDKLKRFVINNLEGLLKLANGEIDYLTEFKPNLILENLNH